ncbi:MAG TPA: DNA polymerase III subunit chi [Gammaproteobacteria bacterium]|nr:DNA polymerase III subunit chi [Gammaproteobacteria bacterium]
MTQVDFYILANDSDEARLRLACRIVDKATEAEQHVFINATSDTEARKLDELLWTFSQGSFIPHKIVRDGIDVAPIEPVVIGLNRGPLGERWDLMINLAAEVPEFFSRYRRVAEVVDGNETRRAASRDRYRFYRDRGYTLNTHQV